MILDVGRALQQAGESFPFVIEEEAPPARQQGRMPQGVVMDAVRVEGYFIGAGETVFVRGSVRARVSQECARCLCPSVRSIASSVHEVYARVVDPVDPDKNAFQGHTLDIEEQVYSTLLLSLPIRSLCRDDCKGLCPVCGADLNDGPCGCCGSGDNGNDIGE